MQKEMPNAGVTSNPGISTAHANPLVSEQKDIALPAPANDTVTDFSHDDIICDIARNNKPDIVASRFTIHLDKLLPDFSTEFAQAFAVTDKTEKDNDSLYCLIYDKGTPIRFNAINALRSITNQHIITPIASEITYISTLKEYHFVVVLSKPPGISLASYIESTGPKTEDFISNMLITQIVPVLELLDNLHVLHGRINPQNIFIETSTRLIVLGECISNPAGYSQPINYETIDRAMTMPLGKGEGETSIDYYATGIVALFVQVGKDPNDDPDILLQSKLINGTFNALLKNMDISPTMTDLYRGLLNDKTVMRWNSSQLKDWLKGKYFNLVRIPPPIEATRSLLFNDVQYFSLQALAHAFSKNWKAARIFLREEKLAKWIEGSVGNPELASRLRYVQKITSSGKAAGGLFDLDDELVSRTIHFLNPQGPFQFRNMSINLNALGAVISFEFSKKKLETVQTLGMIFTQNLFGYLECYTGKDSQNSKLIWHIKNVTEFISMTGLGFGIERCLYELNPALPCQSPLVAADIPLTIKELIEALDARCTKSEEYPVDRHIAAFIAHRINLSSEIRIKGLAGHPKFSNNRHIQATALLMMAQKESGIKKLKGIPCVMAKHLVSITEMLHGKTQKKEMEDNINKVAKEGNMSTLYKVVADHQFILLNQQSFDEAHRQYQQLERQLSKLKGKNTIANLGYHYGLRLSMVLAYILCGLEFIYFVMR